MGASRTKNWTEKMKNIIRDELCTTIDDILKRKLDAYEYETLCTNDFLDRIGDNVMYGWNTEMFCLKIHKMTNGTVSEKDFSERTKEIMHLLDDIYEIARYARGTLEQEKDVEKAIFDDNGKCLSELLDRIVGE